jgi:PhnB protein
MVERPASVPDGYLAVTPWVIVDGVPAFLDFLAAVFDAQEVVRLPGPDGRVAHAEARINGGPVMMFDSHDGWPPTPAFLRVYLPDVDGVVRRATAAGAVVVTPPTTLWIGDRVARVRDSWDNLLWVHTRVAEPTMEQLVAGPTDDDALRADRVVADTLVTEMRRRGRAARLWG